MVVEPLSVGKRFQEKTLERLPGYGDVAGDSAISAHPKNKKPREAAGSFLNFKEFNRGSSASIQWKPHIAIRADR